MRIPRQIPISNCIICLLGFSDASEKGYDAALYLNSTNDFGVFSCCLVRAKSKAAALKTTTISRLEFSGALLLSQLLRDFLDPELSISFEEISIFSDSQIALTRIKTGSHLLKT